MEPVCGIDSETEKIKNKYDIPKVVVAGFCSGNEVQIVHYKNLREYQIEFLHQNPTTKIAFFNGGFDMPVLGEDIWLPELQKEGRIMEIQVGYRTWRMNSHGWFPGLTNLEGVTKETTGEQLDKDEDIRLTYTREMFEEGLWSDRHELYMAKDAIATKCTGMAYRDLPTETVQARAAFVLSQVSRNGMRQDQKYVRDKGQELYSKLETLKTELKSYGFRVKEETDGMKQVDRLVRALEFLGFEDIEKSFKDVKNIRKTWWKLACLVLYRTLEPGGILPSEVQEAMLPLFDILLDPPKDCAATKRYFAEVDAQLLEILENMDCAECLTGVGDAKPGTSSVAFVFFFELLAEAFSLGQTLKNMDYFQSVYSEIHEDNMGWLPVAEKPLSATQYLQNHAKGLMAKYDGLRFVYTDGARKNISERLLAERKLASKEGRPVQKVDISDLEIFQLKQCDMWRLHDVGGEDHFLDLYFDFKHTEKLLSTYITTKYVEADGKIHCRFTPFLRTGRVACSVPNLQNLPNELGIREQYVPKEGNVFVSVDYGQEEIVTLAYTLKRRYGKSVMYDLVNRGLDLHSVFSMYRENRIPGIDLGHLSDQDCALIKELTKDYKDDNQPERAKSRKLSKACNFGFGGGMAYKTFYINCRRQGLHVTMEECVELREAWFTMYPEMRVYIQPPQDGSIHISVLKRQKNKEDNQDDLEDIDIEASDEFEDVQVSEDGEVRVSTRDRIATYWAVAECGLIRAKATLTAACNFPFQCLASVVSKHALWLVYLDSLKHGYTVVNMIHDEIMVECAEEMAAWVATRVQELMVKAAGDIMPGIFIKAEPAISRRWTTEANPVYNEEGVLIPWEDSKEYQEKREKEKKQVA